MKYPKISVGRYLRPYYKAWILNEHMKNFSVKVFSVKSKSAINIGSEIVKMLSQQKAFIYFDSNFVFVKIARCFIIGSRNISWFRVYKLMRNYSSPLDFLLFSLV